MIKIMKINNIMPMKASHGHVINVKLVSPEVVRLGVGDTLRFMMFDTLGGMHNKFVPISANKIPIFVAVQGN